MHANFRRSHLPLAALAIALGATACADATSPAGKGISVSFTTKASTAPVLQNGSMWSPRLSVTATSGSNTIVISKVQMVFSKMELASSTATCSGTTEDDCPELHLDPVLVDIPLDAAVATAINVAVPAGSYTKLEAKIDAIAAGSTDVPGAAAFLAAHPDFTNVSVHVEGTWNGQPFSFNTPAEAELELAFNPPLVVDATGMNLTVNVDVASWFRMADGSLIDPATAAPGGQNASIVGENIKRSLKVYEDDDHDGQDDHA